MALTTTVPFWVARMSLPGGHALLTSPLYPEVMRVDAAPAELGALFERAAYKTWSKEGEVLPWLTAVPSLELQVEVLPILFRRSGRDPVLPDMELRFPIAVSPLPTENAGRSAGWMGFVPGLALSAWGKDLDGLRAALTDAIRIEFGRNRRLLSARDVLQTQWIEQLTLHKVDVQATFHTLNEQKQLNEELPDPLLPQISLPMYDKERRIFEVDDRVMALAGALKSAVPGHLLLVGPEGVGKSGLVEELLRLNPAGLGPVRMTNAPTMERVLTASGGWQQPLLDLCREAQKSGVRLWVRRFSELFEVGRYEGNSVSIGEHLRPILERGDVLLISECTPHELARIEALYPGIIPLFQQFEVKPLPAERLQRLLVARADVTARAEGGAIREALRLLQRFAPYSGYPARAVRFIEGFPADSVIDRDAVLERFCAESGIPRLLIDPSQAMPVDELQTWFQERIFGQPDAVAAVVDVLISTRTAMARRGRPVASLLLVGPTGVGKTETARALATFMFGAPERLVRLDMSEYSTPTAALRLIEGPDGEGRLTGAVRREPFCVLLLDELEKADPLVFDLLLQVLGEGRLTDGKGRVADFCSAVVVMTSNVGAGTADRARPGFGGGPDRAAAWQSAVSDFFRPELLNRIDRILPFAPLDEASIQRVLDRELRALVYRPGFSVRRATLTVSPAARARLVSLGYAPRWGARQIQRVVRRELSAPISAAINPFSVQVALKVEVDLIEDRFVVRARPRPVEDDPSLLGAVADESADTIAALRRRIDAVRHGFSTQTLTSERQRLLRQKARFLEREVKRNLRVEGGRSLESLQSMALVAWNGQDDARRLLQIDAALSAQDELLQQTEALDLERLSGACTWSPDPEFTTWYNAVDARRWQVWQDLFQLTTSASDVVTVGLYGNAGLSEQETAYVQLSHALGWRIQIRRLYLLGEWLLITDEKNLITAEKSLVTQEPYVTRRAGQPLPFHATLLGVELEVKGVGALTLFQKEGGVHLWNEEDDKIVGFLVTCRSTPWSSWVRPADAHRFSYLHQTPRRQLKYGVIQDREYRVSWSRTDYVHKLMTYLKDWLENYIYMSLVG